MEDPETRDKIKPDMCEHNKNIQYIEEPETGEKRKAQDRKIKRKIYSLENF